MSPRKRTKGQSSKKEREEKYEFNGDIIRTGFIIDPGAIARSKQNEDIHN